jgi:hypothetical protein
LPVIMTNANGNYIFSGLSKKVPPPPKPIRIPVAHRHRNITEVPDAVHQWPQFEGGNDNFLKYLEKTGKALAPSLPDGTKKAFVVVEFIVDADGTPTNFKMARGINQDFDEELITVLEKMPNWQPALLNNKPTAWKIKQSFAIE